MKRKLTVSEVVALRPCSDRAHLFGKRKTLTVRQALKAGATVSDILWVAGRLGLGQLCADFARGCATRAATYADDAATYAARAATYATYAAAATTYATYADEIAEQTTSLITLFGDIS